MATPETMPDQMMARPEQKRVLVDKLLKLMDELAILLNKLNKERGPFRFDKNQEIKDWRTRVLFFIASIQEDFFSNFEDVQGEYDWEGNVDRDKLVPWRAEEIDMTEDALEHYVGVIESYKKSAEKLELL